MTTSDNSGSSGRTAAPWRGTTKLATRGPNAPDENPWESREHVQTVVQMTVTAAGLYLCYRLAVPFLPSLTWAFALAILFVPLQRYLERKTVRPSFAASLTVAVVLGIVVLPIVFVGQQLILQAAAGVDLIQERFTSGVWRVALEKYPRVAAMVAEMEQQFDLPGTASTISGWLSQAAGSLVSGSLVQVLALVLTFYLLFFLLRDRRLILHSLRQYSPFAPSEMDRMYRQVGNTVVATVYGTLIVAAVQGFLGGAMFWLLGLPGPLLWGVIMGLLSVVPVIGAFVIWVPAALLLAIEGEWIKALILAGWGTFIVGTADNLLRPLLIGKRLRQHSVIAFISILGGLMLFGSSGLILGPVIVAVTSVMLEVWRRRSAELEEINDD